MALRLGINLGFVTNSSSVVYHFPVAVLQDPTVQAFLNAFEISGGFVGADLWHRGACGTFAVTREQKEECQRKFASINDGTDDPVYGSIPGVPMGDDSVTVIYGDEYQSLASSLVGLLQQAAKKMGIKDLMCQDYN